MASDRIAGPEAMSAGRGLIMQGSNLVALAAVLVALNACAQVVDPWAPQTIAQENIGYTPGASTIYCYSTLAEVDCYDEPQPGPPNRFVSGYVYE